MSRRFAAGRRGVGVRRGAAIVLLAWTIAVPTLGARVVAVGDVHGADGELASILAASGLVDEKGDWAGGTDTLVQTGDLLDRGPGVRAAMDLLIRLQEQAPRAGGEVIVLSGNHEQMNLYGAYRDVGSEAYAAFVDEQSESRRESAWEAWREWVRARRLDAPPPTGSAARREWMDAHPPGLLEYRAALAPEGAYGGWLRSLPVVGVVDSTLFLHAGLDAVQGRLGVEEVSRRYRESVDLLDASRAELLELGLVLPWMSLDEIRDVVIAELEEPSPIAAEDDRLPEVLARAAAAIDGLYEHLAAESSLWYRGWSNLDDVELGELVDELTAALGVDRLVAAHSPRRDGRILARADGRVFLIDTGMLQPVYGGRPSALEVDDGGVTAIYVDSREVLVEGNVGSPAEVARWLDRDGRPLPFSSDDEVLEFLSTAPVVAAEDIPVGITRPRRLELEADGVRVRAAFRYHHKEGQFERLSGGRTHMFFLDSFRNEVAAYELARLLGMENVPPAVLRTVDGTDGSVQLWIEGATMQTTRQEEGYRPTSIERVAMARQSQDMRMFDNLINNIDRNAGNILWGADGKLWLIDHTRAFARVRELPASELVEGCSRRLWAALRTLNEEAVEERLRPYLGSLERKALLRRHGALVRLLEEKIAAEGEAAVLFDSYSVGG